VYPDFLSCGDFGSAAFLRGMNAIPPLIQFLRDAQRLGWIERFRLLVRLVGSSPREWSDEPRLG